MRAIAVITAPGFNMAATTGFIDAFRACNYLAGEPLFSWTVSHVGQDVPVASNGMALQSTAVSTSVKSPDIGVISTSWTPEDAYGAMTPILRRWARFGSALVGLDTGAFVLAEAGLLTGRRATVHYEHIDAFAEMYPDVEATEDLYTIDGPRMTAAGGVAATDLALQIVRVEAGEALANAAARYIFHERLRPAGERQLPGGAEPAGATVPDAVRTAIQHIEDHLEEVIPVPAIAAQTLNRSPSRVVHAPPTRTMRARSSAGREKSRTRSSGVIFAA